MRILQLVSAFAYSGPAEPMLALSVSLAARGHEVTVGHDTVRPEGNVHEEGMGPRVKATGLPVAHELALCTQSGPITWARDVVRLRKRMQQVDVVHVHFSHDHVLAQAARPAHGGPALVRTIHSERSLRARPLQGALLRRADALVVHSEELKRLGCERLHLDPARVHVIGGAVDLARFTPVERESRAARFRVRHNLPAGPTVAMVAIFQKGRGQERLLAAWPAIRAQLPDAQLWFVGLGEEREHLMAQARDLPGVHFLGYLTDELPDAYTAADVTVLLAVGNDGFGRAMLESLASGTPVVGADIPPVASVLRGRNVGTLVPPHDVDALASAVVAALREGASRRGEARALVEREYSQDRVTEQTLALYRALRA
ncbi:MAG: glycosyltransferase family 4 protein [Myxococcota bacterium]